MLVKKLIKKLKEMPDNAEVMIIPPQRDIGYLKVIDCEAESTTLVTLGADYQEDEKKEVEWKAYLDYLKRWAEDSADVQFSGNSPVGFDEFLMNEF